MPTRKLPEQAPEMSCEPHRALGLGLAWGAPFLEEPKDDQGLTPM